MPNLISLDEAKNQLRVTWDDEDTHISLLCDASEMAILNYIKKDYGWTSANVPQDVKLSILVLLNTYYEAYRDGDDFDNNTVAFGYPPPAVSWLLHRYRKPAYA